MDRSVRDCSCRTVRPVIGETWDRTLREYRDQVGFNALVLFWNNEEGTGSLLSATHEQLREGDIP